MHASETDVNFFFGKRRSKPFVQLLLEQMNLFTFCSPRQHLEPRNGHRYMVYGKKLKAYAMVSST